MNRVSSVAFRVAIATTILLFGVIRLQMQAQTPGSPTGASPGGVERPGSPTGASPGGVERPAPPASSPATQAPAKEAAAEDANPFAPEPAAPLPPGMAGSDVNDPRARLTPGLYDAGEAAMGMKHLMLAKKPDAFQLASTDPDDPKVQKVLSQLRGGNLSNVPRRCRW